MQLKMLDELFQGCGVGQGRKIAKFAVEREPHCIGKVTTVP